MDEKEQLPEGGVLNVVSKISNWQTYVIYALLIAVALMGFGFVWERGEVAKAQLDVAHKQAEVTQLKTERDIAKANESSCRVNLAQQNTDITNAGKRYDQLKSEFDKLQKDIDSGKYYKSADDVKKQPVPKTCQETLDFFNRNFP